jgi:hypothetical protein
MAKKNSTDTPVYEPVSDLTEQLPIDQAAATLAAPVEALPAAAPVDPVAPVAAAQTEAADVTPSAGGSYNRDPDTGELTLSARTADPMHPEEHQEV